MQGRSGIGPFDPEVGPGLRFENVAQVRGYDPLAHFEPDQLDLLDRFAQFRWSALARRFASPGWSGRRGCAVEPPSSPAPASAAR